LSHKQARAGESDDGDEGAHLDEAIHGMFLQLVKRQTGANSLISEGKAVAITVIQ
jgi:hypothetical protein